MQTDVIPVIHWYHVLIKQSSNDTNRKDGINEKTRHKCRVMIMFNNYLLNIKINSERAAPAPNMALSAPNIRRRILDEPD